MTQDYLSHCLTDEQHRHFEEQGYLIVENALSEEMIDRLTAAVDGLHKKAIEAEPTEHGKAWSSSNFLGEDDAFLDLLDYPTTLPKIWGVLGWNIYLYHAHMHIKPPAEPNAPQEEGWLEWHQDSGRVNIEMMESHPRPRLSLKVGYFLTDVSEPGRGNFYIIPGSHLSDDIPTFSEVGRNPREGTADSVPDAAIPMCAKPGTAVFFDRRLWHSRSPNRSAFTRKVLFYGYGYRWIRPKDDMVVEHLYDCCNPIRRQLLGAAVRNDGRYVPTDDDVPLKMWLIEHLGEETIVAMDRRR